MPPEGWGASKQCTLAPVVSATRNGDYVRKGEEEGPVLRNFSFLLLYLILQNYSPAVDFRTVNQAHYTSLINDETIAVWRQKLSEHSNANTIKYVTACLHFIFSKVYWNLLA